MIEFAWERDDSWGRVLIDPLAVVAVISKERDADDFLVTVILLGKGDVALRMTLAERDQFVAQVFGSKPALVDIQWQHDGCARHAWFYASDIGCLLRCHQRNTASPITVIHFLSGGSIPVNLSEQEHGRIEAALRKARV